MLTAFVARVACYYVFPDQFQLPSCSITTICLPYTNITGWIQLLACSSIPIILFFLALYLTHSPSIAYATGWLTALHPGLIITTFDPCITSLSVVVFYFFLYYFYRSFSGIYQEYHIARWKKDLIVSAILLAIFSIFRPIGIYVALIAALILACIAQNRLRYKWTKITLFLATFLICICPWFIGMHMPTIKPAYVMYQPFQLFTHHSGYLFYFELIYMSCILVGFLGGLGSFLIMPLTKRLRVPAFMQNIFGLWLKTVPMIVGFLTANQYMNCPESRLPIEPLIIILSLTFWQRVWSKKDQ